MSMGICEYIYIFKFCIIDLYIICTDGVRVQLHD